MLAGVKVASTPVRPPLVRRLLAPAKQAALDVVELAGATVTGAVTGALTLGLPALAGRTTGWQGILAGSLIGAGAGFGVWRAIYPESSFAERSLASTLSAAVGTASAALGMVPFFNPVLPLAGVGAAVGAVVALMACAEGQRR